MVRQGRRGSRGKQTGIKSVDTRTPGLALLTSESYIPVYESRVWWTERNGKDRGDDEYCRASANKG